MLSLKDAKVTEYKAKSRGLKGSINFVSKQVQRIWSHSNPHVLPETESNTDVKASTKFKLEQEMMVFIILVCNGDWDIMTTSGTCKMAWYKEWRFYFHFIWGCNITT